MNTGYDYLAIGIPFQEVNGDSSAGAIQILYGSSGGLVANNASHFFHQDSVGIPGGTEPGDRFGHALATAGWSHALLFRDSFETGDTSRWSYTDP